MRREQPSVQKGRTEDRPSQNENYPDPVGIRTREWQLCGIGACFLRKKETAHLAMARYLGAYSPAAIKHVQNMWAHQSKRYNKVTVVTDVR